jgi:hypothetical protein
LGPMVGGGRKEVACQDEVGLKSEDRTEAVRVQYTKGSRRTGRKGGQLHVKQIIRSLVGPMMPLDLWPLSPRKGARGPDNPRRRERG